MALAQTVGLHCIGLACLTSVFAGCVSTTTSTGGTGLSRNYPADTPVAQNRGKKSNLKLHMAYARLKESEGDLPEARNSYEQVLTENPKSIDAILGIARLDQLAGRVKAAEEGYARALKIDPKSPQALDAQGEFYASQGRWNEAVQALSNAVSNAPEEKAYRHHLAVTLAKSGQIEQSIPHFIQAVGPAAAHYNVGLILHEKGDLQGAEEQFAFAVLKNPKLEQAQYWLDEVHRELDPQMANANTPASVGGVGGGGVVGGVGSNINETQVVSYQTPQQPAQSPTRNTPPQATANSPARVSPVTASAASPVITAGAIQQSPQYWPSATPQPPAIPAFANSGSRQSSTDPYGTVNRVGTTLLPSSTGNPPDGLTAQQWEQRNNQRALDNSSAAANFGPGTMLQR